MALSIAYTIIARDKFADIAAKVSKATDKMRESMKKASAAAEKFSGAAHKSFQKFKGLKELSEKAMMKVTLPLAGAGIAMVKFASDMEETLNKVDVSFGDSSQKVKDWAKTSTTQMGLASQSALDAAALFGDMGAGMGLTQARSADMAMSLTQLSADLASFKNVSQEVAKSALKGIYTGETESLKNLGVVMTQVDLQNYALSKGITTKIDKMSQAQKVMLRYSYVMDKTKNAQGDFARTSGGAANQMRMLQENIKELAIVFGTIILPYATKIIVKLNEWIVKFQGLSETSRTVIVIIGVVAAAIPPLLFAIAALTTALTILSANPIVFTIAAIVAGLFALYKISQFVIGAITKIAVGFDKIKSATGFFGKMKAAWSLATDQEVQSEAQSIKMTKEIQSKSQTDINSKLDVNIIDKGSNVKSASATSNAGAINLNIGKNTAGAY